MFVVWSIYSLSLDMLAVQVETKILPIEAGREEKMQNMFNWAASNMPFAALMAANPPHNRPMLTRLIEQGTVGIVAAMFGIYINDIRQQDQIQNLTIKIAEVQQAQRDSINTLTAKIEEMRRDLYVPRNRR